MAWVKWSQVLSSFEKRGLQIGSLKAFNLALLQKWHWRLPSSPNNMWVNIIKALHGREGGLNNQVCSFNGTWSRIIGTLNFLHSKGIIPLNSFCFKVGCGTRVRFWKDIWIGDLPFHTRYNRLYRLDQDKDCLIIDRIVNDRLPHRLNLSSRGLDIPTIYCSSCNGIVKYVDHVFFECDLVKEIWCLVRKWLLRRNLVVYMLSLRLYFDGYGDIVTVLHSDGFDKERRPL
nr:RNA-directed DNA polymerase, eukaryota, reverse transcriptase zinc-binding domain protein [Tanacetum cinerariifolium]